MPLARSADPEVGRDGVPSVGGACNAVRRMSSLRCPQCGGEIAVGSGERLPVCPFCDAPLFVDRGGLVSHYSLPRLVDAAGAAAALRRWMAGNETVKDLDRKAEVLAVEAVSFPMWMFRLQGRQGETVVVEPGAPTPIPQLADLEVPAGKLVPFRPEEGNVERTVSTVPLATARGWLAQREQAARGAMPRLDQDAEVSEAALVELPLWRCRYRHAGAEYVTLVDGSTGAALAAVYPAKSESPYWIVAIAGAVLFLVEGIAIPHFFWRLVAYVATAVPLVGLAWLVARKV